MYIIIQQEPFKVVTFETKTDLANYLGVHRNTVTNRFEASEWWESDKGSVYFSTKHYKRQTGGNTDDKITKIRKINGEIPCKNPKLNTSS